MIYGYAQRVINSYGLQEMREISISASPSGLRELAKFLLDTADEMDGELSPGWHRHAPDQIRRDVDCEVVVMP